MYIVETKPVANQIVAVNNRRTVSASVHVATQIVDVKEQDIVLRASGYENQLLDTSNGKNLFK